VVAGRVSSDQGRTELGTDFVGIWSTARRETARRYTRRHDHRVPPRRPIHHGYRGPFAVKLYPVDQGKTAPRPRRHFGRSSDQLVEPPPKRLFMANLIQIPSKVLSPQHRERPERAVAKSLSARRHRSALNLAPTDPHPKLFLCTPGRRNCFLLSFLNCLRLFAGDVLRRAATAVPPSKACE
jgi:hypothetical protein